MEAGWVHCSLLRNVAVNNLRHSESALIGEEVKGLRLDVGPFHLLPLQIVAADFGVGSLFGFFSHRSDGGRAVDGLLRAGDIGDPADKVVPVVSVVLTRTRLSEPKLREGKWVLGERQGCPRVTYCC